MRVTFAQLEAFVWVARLGKVGDAAHQLNLAQPTVSLRLRDLERSIGARVFEKDGRRLTLTAEGTSLLERANVILDEVDRIRTPLASARVQGRIRLGASETFATTGLASVLQTLADKHKGLRVELSVGPSEELIEALHDRRVDLAVVVNPAADARLVIAPLGVQQSTWAASPALALPAVVRPRDLHHLNVLVNPPPSANHRQTMAWFAAAGLEPMRPSFCNTVPSVVAHLVEAGIGVAILPTKLIEPQLSSGRLVALGCRPPIENAYLCGVRRANDALPAGAAVLDAVRQCLGLLDFLEPI